MRPLAVAAVLFFATACQKGAAPGAASSAVPPGSTAGTPGNGGAPPGGGTPDAGVPVDTGPNPHRIGGLGFGPFPAGSMMIYGSAQGLLEAPVSASVDESEDLWVVTQKALYLLAPGAKVFRRFTAADGLHYGPGFTDGPDITLVEGGAAGECFVGYFFHDTNDSMFKGAHTNLDPFAHMGKMDQVLLQPDGSLKINRYDLRNSNDGHFYETRTVMSMVYDHFQHPGNLYVGSNHGITRIIPAKYTPPPPELKNDPWNTSWERQWYADHVHPWTCIGALCTGDTNVDHVSFGDWFGLALAPDGRLWMGGLTTAGAINFREDLHDWVQSWAPFNPFSPAFETPPVFTPPASGDAVNIRAVAVAPDGMVWFASGEVEAWRGPTYGLAGYDGHRFSYFDPMRLGAIEFNILELQALSDGRLVLGFPSSGLLVWNPADDKGHRVTQRDGLPGESIGRMSYDRMHDPPLLLVPTEGGLAIFRDVP